MRLSSGLFIFLASVSSATIAHAESPANMSISDQYTSLAITGIPDMVQGEDRKNAVNAWNKFFPQWVKHEEETDGYVLDQGFYDCIKGDSTYKDINLSDENIASDSEGKIYFSTLSFSDTSGDRFIFKYMTVKKKEYFITTNEKQFPTSIHIEYKLPNESINKIDTNYKYSGDFIIPMLLTKPHHADSFYNMLADYSKHKIEFLPFPVTMMLPED
ncbi:hypothetical protein NO263_13175 [Gluconacetobacter entanii]|uniref:DUF4468 domain-containing protein n=1 Tax=Gluconacetobacter entanii TaxID=108528 RepID=A0ABT3K829_9PROT|nr:hypothetical protein [Gluconacetobacter entanii]MCW4591533.1 hypothetical protein [Gluconacetobacter entanii]MCW4595423.1 hypothetical protein [Gluconacetobacter entanii]NPC89852.1 hypothetical protein [Gluconacetobacter entanii]